MRDVDLVPFTATFHRLRGVFALRGDHAEIQQIVAVYFKVLRRYPIEAVTAGADLWAEKGTRFPKPVEWITSMPRRITAEVLEVSQDEAGEYLRAERLRFEDEPCSCRACLAAGVTHRCLRYVPEQHDLGGDAKGRIGDRVIVRGRWIHGDALARWYVARDAFWAPYQRVVKGLRMPRRKRTQTEAQVLDWKREQVGQPAPAAVPDGIETAG